jgi:DNA-binding response OmpR family regulator
VPVMLLSGIRKDDQDIIQGLDHGADEYLLKNVKLEVLLARVRALLRKEQATKNPKLNIGPIVLNTVYRQVWLEQREVQLTAKEYSILEYLAYHPNIVITRTKIEQHVWNLEFDISSNVVDEHIMNLRKKLGSVLTIETVRGVGYRLKV